MKYDDLREVGIHCDPEEQVERLANLANHAGLDGVVSSALEVDTIKATCGNSFLTITPGIRPAGSNTDDQERIMTPKDAIDAGSDYLVIGRPITQAKDPKKVLKEINASIS
jgi:orotidine-5'-phosphate decarboxylase